VTPAPATGAALGFALAFAPMPGKALADPVTLRCVPVLVCNKLDDCNPPGADDQPMTLTVEGSRALVASASGSFEGQLLSPPGAEVTAIWVMLSELPTLITIESDGRMVGSMHRGQTDDVDAVAVGIGKCSDQTATSGMKRR
jgi:hypothetical protein